VSLLLIVNNDREKKNAVTTIMARSAHRDSMLKEPETTARLSRTTGVNGAIQLNVCTTGGNDESGKNTPLKKNMGVINRLK
jgi:hypothetical protein